MADRTSIEWVSGPDGTPGSSWNPIRAIDRFTGQPGWFCEILSPGCEHCYAAAINHRLGTGGRFLHKDREKYEIVLDEKILTAPLRWRRPRKIFVCSMSDLFGEWVPDEMIDRIMAVAALAPQHKFLILTKRAKRMREYFTDPNAYRRVLRAAEPLREKWPRLLYVPISDPSAGSFWPHVWKGVSVEDQRRAEFRVPDLLQTPAAVRWISAEPLLEGVSLDLKSGINWVVVGGESGPDARPFNLDWARSIIAQCAAANVPCFVKQIGAAPMQSVEASKLFGSLLGAHGQYRNRKGGDPDEWPVDLRVREFPT